MDDAPVFLSEVVWNLREPLSTASVCVDGRLYPLCSHRDELARRRLPGDSLTHAVIFDPNQVEPMIVTFPAPPTEWNLLMLTEQYFAMSPTSALWRALSPGLRLPEPGEPARFARKLYPRRIAPERPTAPRGCVAFGGFVWQTAEELGDVAPGIGIAPGGVYWVLRRENASELFPTP